MITVNWLLHLGHSATNAPVSSLDCLEINYGSFVQVVELRMMPVSFSSAKVLFISTCSLCIGANDRDIVFYVFQGEVQLQIIRLLRGSLVVTMISSSW